MLMRAGTQRVQSTSTTPFPAPDGGWVQSGNLVLAKPNQAERLDNFIPTAQGARLRGGATEYADLGTRVDQVMVYVSGTTTDIFGCTANSVFDADRVASGSNAFAELEGLSDGYWSYTQISTSAGQFLVAVNGSNHAVYWDGTNFEPITTVAVNDLGFDAETSAFTVGDTLTGGTSGATAEILAITKTSATAGTLKLGTVTGTFQNDETITDGSGGSATADGADSSGSAITITNVDTDLLSQVWLFKERLFFVEKDTTSVWYLPVDSIGGAATEIDLGSVLRKGGSILFGATWSLDSGSGLDDVCIFVSDQGEIVVYEGTDPSSASTWSLVGVYEIGKPLNKTGFFRAGGDLAILTEDGIISVAEALRKDRAALQAIAISYPIEDAWNDAVTDATSTHRISATLWQSKTLLLVGTPSTFENKTVSLAANSRTGAWGRITGWDVRCSAVADDQLYFGNGDGQIMKADSGGDDDGMAYTATYVPKFNYSDDCRTATAANLTYKATEELPLSLHAHSDYVIGAITTPNPISVFSESSWGTGVWGTFIWGSSETLTQFNTWQSVNATGYALAPGVSVTSNQTDFPYFELISMRLRHETGYAL